MSGPATPVPAVTPLATPPAARGRLLLVPTPLDHGCASLTPLPQTLPLGVIETAARTRHWVCENAKSARAFLKRVGDVVPLAQPLQAQHITELPRQVHKKGDHRLATAWDARPLLAPALQGHDVGLLSEAGMPAVADPGSGVVQAAHALGLIVQPLPGPSALLLALAASGLNGQHFAFAGYLPQEAAAREQRIRALEAAALSSGQTQLFIETPYRNAAMLQALLRTLKPGTRLAWCAGLTLAQGQAISQRVADWRRQAAAGPLPLDMALPAIYLIGA